MQGERPGRRARGAAGPTAGVRQRRRCVRVGAAAACGCVRGRLVPAGA